MENAQTEPALQIEGPVTVSPNDVSAPIYLRCVAFFIDYMLLLTPPIVLLISAKVFRESLGNSGISGFAWYLVLVLWILNFFAIPLLLGQTVGKMFAGITMVKTDGSPVRLSSLLLRNCVGYLLTILTLGLGFLIALVNKRGRALHDYIGGTIVVQGRRKQA